MSANSPNISSGLSLRANFSWTFLGNFVYAGCQWGIVSLFARIGSPMMVGQYALGLAIAVPVLMFTNLELVSIQVTDARGDYQFADYFGLRLISTVLALLVIIGIVIIFGYRQETALVILAIGFAKSIEAITDIFYGLFRQHERMDLTARSMLIKGPFSLLALGIGVEISRNIFWGVMALGIAWLFILISYDMRNGAKILLSNSCGDKKVEDYNDAFRIIPRWNLATLRQLIWTALPLGITLCIISLNVNIPRYFVQYYYGEHDLGIFVGIAYLEVVGLTIIRALGQAASPRLAKYHAVADDIPFRRLALRMVGIGVAFGTGGILVALIAGREVLNFLYGSEYSHYAHLLTLYMVYSGAGYIVSMLGYAATARRRLRYQPLVVGVVLVVTIAACSILVPRQGLEGAVIALISSALVSILLYTWVTFAKAGNTQN